MAGVGLHVLSLSYSLVLLWAEFFKDECASGLLHADLVLSWGSDVDVNNDSDSLPVLADLDNVY